jgi:hypothetical protein
MIIENDKIVQIKWCTILSSATYRRVRFPWRVYFLLCATSFVYQFFLDKFYEPALFKYVDNFTIIFDFSFKAASNDIKTGTVYDTTLQKRISKQMRFNGNAIRRRVRNDVHTNNFPCPKLGMTARKNFFFFRYARTSKICQGKFLVCSGLIIIIWQYFNRKLSHVKWFSKRSYI